MLVDQDQVARWATPRTTSCWGVMLAFEGTEVQQDESRGLRYWWADFDSEDDLTLFMSQTRPGEDGTFAAPQPGGDRDPPAKLAAAWLDLVPRLALAGLIALIVSFIVSYFISRSISGPLARITAASKQMAQGNYDVYIPIKGQDEVGRLSEAFNQRAAGEPAHDARPAGERLPRTGRRRLPRSRVSRRRSSTAS